jgi:hypothetical protein
MHRSSSEAPGYNWAEPGIVSRESRSQLVPCFHGNPVEFNTILCSLCAALRVLELAPGATEKEIKDAYRIRVKVWHPDRFQGDDSIRQIAEAKLKEINAAYILLTSHSAEESWGGGQPAEVYTGAETPAWRAHEAQQAAGARTTPAPASPRSFPAWIFPALNLSFRIGLLLLAVLAGRDLWIAFDLPNASSEVVAQVSGYGKDSVVFGFDTPKRRFLEAIEKDLRRIGLKDPLPALDDLVSSKNPLRPGGSVRPAPAVGAEPEQNQAMPSSNTAPMRIFSYLTIGSTSNEVVTRLGEPTAWADNKLVYGRSELYFKDDRVVGWRIDPFSSPIPVKLWPAASVDPAVDRFTIGSSKDVVLVAQGTPTAFSEDTFEYAGSEVHFQDGRVIGWKSDPYTIPLRIAAADTHKKL